MEKRRRVERMRLRASACRPCRWCAQTFTPVQPTRQRFCSAECSRLSKVKNPPIPTLKCDECGQDFQPPKNRAVRGQRFCSPRCGQRDVNRRRRARQADAFVAEVSLAAISERDGWLCGLCSDPVDPDLRHPDPMSASLDHVVPLARGGTHEPANCQLAHYICNCTKGARCA